MVSTHCQLIPGGWWSSHGGSAQGGREGERPKCAQGEKEDARAHDAGLCAVAAAAVEQIDDDASPSPGSRRWLVPPVPEAWKQDDKRVLALNLYVVWVRELNARGDHCTGVNGESNRYEGAPSESLIARQQTRLILLRLSENESQRASIRTIPRPLHN